MSACESLTSPTRGFGVKRLDGAANDLVHRLQQGIERNTSGSGHVDDLACGLRSFACAQDTVDHIRDVGEIARLLAVAVNGGARPSRRAVAKSEMTPEYGDPGSCLGPKTLK